MINCLMATFEQDRQRDNDLKCLLFPRHINHVQWVFVKANHDKYVNTFHPFILRNDVKLENTLFGEREG